MKPDLPMVTIVVPARDEEDDIEACLGAILDQDYPHDRLEVLVVDGDSSDGTPDRARVALTGSDLACWAVLSNPNGTTPSNLNAGLSAASGEVLCRVDARSLIPRDYVKRTATILANRSDVVVVGGRQVPVADDNDPTARAIARALRNPYVTGLARYRRGVASGTTDTVYLGVFRMADLRAVGGWDERFATNQDYELNRRLADRGAVWFEAQLDVLYRPRRDLLALGRQYRRFGRWKAAGWLEAGVPIASRQLVLVAAPIGAGAATAIALWRNPALVAVVGALGFASSIVLAAPGAPIAERFATVGAATVIGGSWWLGVVEQLARHRLLGQRLLRVGTP